jgi:DNA-binding transcriptional LysR family regulator
MVVEVFYRQLREGEREVRMSASPEGGREARARTPAASDKCPARPGTLTTLYRLRCFEMVVEEAGFKRATARLHITQPALSYQMKHLEAELGAQLFHRRPGGVSLTEAGRTLFAHVQRVSAAVREAELAIKELPAVGEVRIGTVNSIGTYFLPQVLWKVHERYAGARPSLYRARSDESIEALLANQVDLAILADPRVDRRLRYETLIEERVSLIAGRGHPLFGTRALQAKALEGAQVVALSQQTPTGALVHRHLARLGVAVEQVVSTEDVETQRRMVEMGMGVAFIPDMVTARDVVSSSNPNARLCRIRVDPPLTRRIVLVTWNEIPPSRAVAAFIEEVRRQASAWPAAVKPQG